MINLCVLINGSFIQVYFQNIFYIPQIEYCFLSIETTEKKSQSIKAYKAKKIIRESLSQICLVGNRIRSSNIVDLADYFF